MKAAGCRLRERKIAELPYFLGVADLLPFHWNLIMTAQQEFTSHFDSLTKALTTLHRLIALVKSPPMNVDRFESCKCQVLNLSLSQTELDRNQQIFRRASRYAEFGELGAVHFELKLLARNLESLLEPKQKITT